MRLLLALGGRLSANPTAESGFSSLLLLCRCFHCCRWSCFFLVPNARVVSCYATTGLSGWVAWLRRVGSCCFRWPQVLEVHTTLKCCEHTACGQVHTTRAWVAGVHGKKCGEGIRIATPDSNFGRLVGWRWVGAGFTGSTRIHCRSGCPSLPQALAHRETEPASQASQTDRQSQSPSYRLHVLDPPSLRQS